MNPSLGRVQAALTSGREALDAVNASETGAGTAGDTETGAGTAGDTETGAGTAGDTAQYAL